MITTALLALLAAFVLTRIIKLLKGLAAVDYVPGFRCAFSTRSLPGLFLPTSLHPIWCNPGSDFLWQLRSTLYDKFDIVSLVPFWSGPPIVYVSSIETMRQIAGNSSPFDKLEWNIFDGVSGSNIFSARKENWKRYKRILNPAFAQKTYSLVWEESVSTFKDMVTTEKWESQQSLFIPIVNSVFTLGIISSCAFGLAFPWSDPLASEDTNLTIQECFRVIVHNIILRLIVPRWMFSLPIRKLREVDMAFTTLDAFMKAQISARKDTIRGDTKNLHTPNRIPLNTPEKNDLFNLILNANANAKDGRATLTDQEVVGNTFVMLLGGHGTTAHVLSAALGLLGVYQDEQELAYREIQSVLADGRDPTFDDYESFKHVSRCFLEAIRLFPSGGVLYREATEDTQLRVPSRVPGELDHEVVLKKGAVACVDIIGINYNPRYFPSPESFQPSRWAMPNPIETDAFVGFGYGPRTCIGRKFALVEGVCFLVMLLRDWKVDIVLKEGESPEEWRARTLVGKVTIGFGVGNIPVRLTRRRK
ncbi:hypothetical protein BOTBODRAFT_118419 [Botryobasidium botryosum FD-172 SS1]|uniref:Cytochrome P450 n=1 Tax=Botryobasidium botryosum (strain FD-172 SS1) TaxID=930990 RepID=A0A067M9W0_BOTB1|nr:hypothetical protein BOTBODRAFT_118419 [Botryobasidium botryosum FD-172 SS1]